MSPIGIYTVNFTFYASRPRQRLSARYTHHVLATSREEAIAIAKANSSLGRLNPNEGLWTCYSDEGQTFLFSSTTMVKAKKRPEAPPPVDKALLREALGLPPAGV